MQFQVQRDRRLLESDGSIDGADHVPSEEDEGVRGEVLPVERRARVHQRLLLVRA